MKSKGTQVEPDDHFKGESQSVITLIHYADYRCPFSGDAFPVLEETLSEWGKRITFIYRHFPLLHLHPGALPLTQFAEAAGEQGFFWEAHELLFRAQRTLSNETLEQFVIEHKIDESRLARDMKSEKVALKIETDIARGKACGVQKTPSFVLNGRVYQNEWHNSGMKEEIAALFK